MPSQSGLGHGCPMLASRSDCPIDSGYLWAPNAEVASPGNRCDYHGRFPVYLVARCDCLDCPAVDCPVGECRAGWPSSRGTSCPLSGLELHGHLGQTLSKWNRRSLAGFWGRDLSTYGSEIPPDTVSVQSCSAVARHNVERSERSKSAAASMRLVHCAPWWRSWS